MRDAALSDSEAISNLEALLFPNSMGERMVRQELRLGKGIVAVTPPLEEAGIIGYVLLRFDEDLVDVTRLGVHPERQRHGVGTRLLQRLFLEGRTVLLTVQKDNQDALRLYFKHGFEIVGHLQSARAWVMKRAIPLK